jgi:hypothetical protein
MIEHMTQQHPQPNDLLDELLEHERTEIVQQLRERAESDVEIWDPADE